MVTDTLLKKGDKKMTDRTPFGYVVLKKQVLPVRHNKQGQLVAMLDDNPAHDYGLWRSVPQATVFSTIAEAEAALNRITAKCNHAWDWISHEERRCSRCGLVRLHTDYQ